MALSSGFMAGIGFSLKPFFLPSLAAIELYLAYRRGIRSFKRPQLLAIGATIALYGLIVVIYMPEYFPFARAAYPLHQAYHPYGYLLPGTSWRAAVVILAMVAAAVVVRPHCPVWTDVLNIVALCLTLAVYAQGKGFLYHWYPAVAIAGVLYCMIAASVLPKLRTLLPLRRLDLILAILVSVSCCFVILFWKHAVQPPPAGVVSLVRRHAEGDAIAALSSYIGAGFPLVNETGVGWASRHPMLWQIPGYYQDEVWSEGGYHPWASMAEGERDFMRSVVSDIERSRPALLLVDLIPPTPAMAGFDFLEYFRREPRFAALLARYEFLEQVGRYRVFKRL
jgi:hypothetical protein